MDPLCLAPCEDRAVQSAIRVAKLNRECIDFRAEQTQESAAPVRGEHCERPESFLETRAGCRFR